MEEKFREWNCKGTLRITYTDIETKEKRKWEYPQILLLGKMQQIISEYRREGINLTNRQLYYQLVTANIIPNAMEIYKRICVFLTDARYGGEIDWDAIEDRGRVPTRPPEWDNVHELVEAAASQFRLPRWSDQPYYLEIYCEKQALENIIAPIANKYHIFFGSNRGYSSASMMYNLAQRLMKNTGIDFDLPESEQEKETKTAIILYVGDHDPSGLDMVRDITDRIEEFYYMGERDFDGDFEVIPLALNMEQIKKYNLPPNPAKTTDSRSDKYIAEFGNKSWELDALKPNILRGIIEKGILEYLDIDKYKTWIEKEREQVKPIEELAKKISEGD